MMRHVGAAGSRAAPTGSGQSAPSVARRPSRVGGSGIPVAAVSAQNVAGRTTDGMGVPGTDAYDADLFADGASWRNLPRGIAFGMLLVVPFWITLVVLALWLW